MAQTLRATPSIDDLEEIGDTLAGRGDKRWKVNNVVAHQLH